MSQRGELVAGLVCLLIATALWWVGRPDPSQASHQAAAYALERGWPIESIHCVDHVCVLDLEGGKQLTLECGGWFADSCKPIRGLKSPLGG